MSWQGNPAVITSANPLVGLNVQMSVEIGTVGQCLRSIVLQYNSRSTNCIVLYSPNQRAANENPPIPEKVSSKRSVIEFAGQAFLAIAGR
jgi:hypothetical protein